VSEIPKITLLLVGHLGDFCHCLGASVLSFQALS
jgi:hypothetical protein